jgi:putative zinc finger/helix-turn-helix YgiT family protein
MQKSTFTLHDRSNMSISTDRKQTDRPFPWMCPHCLREDVFPDTIEYTTRVKHDGFVHEVAVPALCIPRCRACGEMVFTDRADDQVSDALRAQLRLLGPDQMVTNRTELGLSQEELASRLGVGVETIRRWETGAVIQSRAMDNLLRLYFGLPAVRAALTGPGMDPVLGTRVVPGSEENAFPAGTLPPSH